MLYIVEFESGKLLFSVPMEDKNWMELGIAYEQENGLEVVEYDVTKSGDMMVFVKEEV